MSPPRENVLRVPRKVLLTGSGWEGARTRSSDHDPAGARQAGGAEKGTEETHHAAAGGRGVEAERAASAAAARQAEGGGRPSGSARIERAPIESQAGVKAARESRADFVRRSVSGIRADVGQRVSGQQTQAADRARSAATVDAASRAVAAASSEPGGSAPVAGAAKL